MTSQILLGSAMTVHVLDLPVEVLVKIFSYVSSRGVILDLSLVCKQFLEVFLSEWYWKTRYRQEVGSQPLMNPPNKSVGTWKVGCVQAEFARRAHHLDCSILPGKLQVTYILIPPRPSTRPQHGSHPGPHGEHTGSDRCWGKSRVWLARLPPPPPSLANQTLLCPQPFQHQHLYCKR